MTAQGLARRTITERLRTLERIETAAAAPALGLDHFQIADWLAGLDVQAVTRGAYHSQLAAFYRWALLSGLRDDNPMQKIPAPKRPKRTPRPVSDAAYHRLLDAADSVELTAMLLLAGRQGLRVSEIARMHSRCIDPDARTLTVRGKGGTEITNPAHPSVLGIAKKMPHGFWFGSQRAPHIGGRTVWQRVRLHMIACRVPGTPHALRHYFCTTLVERGADLRVVQELARHSQLSTTAGYVAVTDDRKRTALELIS